MAKDAQIHALEAFSFGDRLGDFVRYFAKRLLANWSLTNQKKFAVSEVVVYNTRYTQQVHKMLSDPLINPQSLLAPVPKGMIATYQDTLDVLLKVLRSIEPELLEDRLRDVTAAFATGMVKAPAVLEFNQQKYDQQVKALDHLYLKNGLNVKPMTSAFGEDVLAGIRKTNVELCTATRTWYPAVQTIASTVKTIELEFGSHQWNAQDSEKLKAILLDLSYRLSLFAVILDQIQIMEHAFVQVLNVIHKASSRT